VWGSWCLQKRRELAAKLGKHRKKFKSTMFTSLQIMDTSGDASLSCAEFCTSIKRLVRRCALGSTPESQLVSPLPSISTPLTSKSVPFPRDELTQYNRYFHIYQHCICEYALKVPTGDSVWIDPRKDIGETCCFTPAAGPSDPYVRVGLREYHAKWLAVQRQW
jgi:hypothetical protein